MTLRKQLMSLSPGATLVGSSIALPNPVAAILSAIVRDYTHTHVAFTVGTAAGSVVAPAIMTPGDGNQLTTPASVGAAALPAAPEQVTTSSEALPVVTAAVATLASDGTTFTLDVAVAAGDFVALTVVELGDMPKAA